MVISEERRVFQAPRGGVAERCSTRCASQRVQRDGSARRRDAPRRRGGFPAALPRLNDCDAAI